MRFDTLVRFLGLSDVDGLTISNRGVQAQLVRIHRSTHRIHPSVNSGKNHLRPVISDTNVDDFFLSNKIFMSFLTSYRGHFNSSHI